jgi:hypothetical protein
MFFVMSDTGKENVANRDIIGQAARLIGTADLPWSVRMSFGLLIGVILLYIILLYVPHPAGDNLKPFETFQDWVLDAIKAIFGAVVAILGHAAGLEKGDIRIARGREADGAVDEHNS